MFPFGHFSFRSLSYNCSAFRYSARHNDSGTPVRPAPCGLSRELSKGQTAEQRFGWRRSGGSLAFLSQLVAPTQLYRTAKQIGGYSLSRSRLQRTSSTDVYHRDHDDRACVYPSFLHWNDVFPFSVFLSCRDLFHVCFWLRAEAFLLYSNVTTRCTAVAYPTECKSKPAFKWEDFLFVLHKTGGNWGAYFQKYVCTVWQEFVCLRETVNCMGF